MGRSSKRNSGPSANRRQYLSWLGVGALAGLAGCAGGEEDSDGTTTTTTGETTTEEGTTTSEEGAGAGVQEGGHLRITGLTPPNSISPFSGHSQGDFVFFEFMYDRLVGFNRDFERVPGLATSWESNEDATEWTFKLREGVEFNNIDKEMRAEDVKATVEALASEEIVPGGASNLAGLDSLEVLDDYRVKAHLKKPNSGYPGRVGETGSWFNIVPKPIIEDDFDKLTSTDYGTGPFNLSDYEAENYYTFEANDDWFGEDSDGNSLPLVDKVTLRVIPDSIAQANALTDQRVDAAHILQTNVRDRVSSAEGASVHEFETSAFMHMVLLTTMETQNGDQPFADVKVRKAMKHALDREAIVTATDGTTLIGHHSPVAPVHPHYAPFDEGLEFGTTAQVEEAKRLLEEAGYGDGIDLPTPIYSTDFDERKGTAMALFKQQMAEAGIRFDIQLVSSDTWLTDYWNQENGWYMSDFVDRMEETTVPQLALHSDGSWNSARWSNEKYDENYQAYLGASTEDEFVDPFHEAQRIMHLDGAWIIFAFKNSYAASNDYVGRYEPGPGSNREFESDAWLTSDAPQGP